MRRFFSILLAVVLLTCLLEGASEYQGQVGQHAAFFSLDWKSDGSVIGSYFYAVQEGQLRTLVGSNYEEGKLYLEEQHGQTLVAQCYLQKTISNGIVVWQGEMQTAEGRFPMHFARQLANTPLPASPAPVKEISDADFAKGISTEVTWSRFPKADQIARVPYAYDSVRYLRAKVETIQSGANHLSLGLRIGLAENGDWSKIRFAGPLVNFRINRHLPIPSKEIVGDEISLVYGNDRELLAMNLLGIGVTHVRKSLNSEKLEAQVIVENDDFFALFDETVSEENRRKAIERIPSFSFLPDKLTLIDEDSDMLMFFRVLQLTRDHGVVIQTLDTGPGMLELEGLTLEAPPEPNPWIAVGDWSSWGPVPRTQRAD